MKTVDIHEELRAYIARKYKTQAAAAKAWGVSGQFVSKVLKGKAPPTEKMLEEAGFEFAKVYVKRKKQ